MPKEINMKELIELDLDLHKEIERHKWLASERAGRDLGEKAIEEWFIKHFQDWKRHQWKKAIESSKKIDYNNKSGRLGRVV